MSIEKTKMDVLVDFSITGDNTITGDCTINGNLKASSIKNNDGNDVISYSIYKETKITGQGSNPVQFFSNGSLRGYITSTSGHLYMDGNIYDNAGMCDVRVKKNITDYQTDVDKFKQIRITKYDRTDKEELKDQIGVIAQELKNIYPDCVDIKDNKFTSIDDFHYVDTVKLQFHTISVLQQLIERIEVLEKKVANKNPNK